MIIINLVTLWSDTCSEVAYMAKSWRVMLKCGDQVIFVYKDDIGSNIYALVIFEFVKSVWKRDK